jgi:serine/threonine protein phosphatase PrpC
MTILTGLFDGVGGTMLSKVAVRVNAEAEING